MRTGFPLPPTKGTREGRSCLIDGRWFVELSDKEAGVGWKVAYRGCVAIISFSQWYHSG